MSQAIIFGGALVNLAFNVRAAHPTQPARPLIAFDCLLLLEPPMLAGTMLGVMLNSICPSWLLVVLLVLCITPTAIRTARTGMRTYRTERAARASAPTPARPPSPRTRHRRSRKGTARYASIAPAASAASDEHGPPLEPASQLSPVVEEEASAMPPAVPLAVPPAAASPRACQTADGLAAVAARAFVTGDGAADAADADAAAADASAADSSADVSATRRGASGRPAKAPLASADSAKDSSKEKRAHAPPSPRTAAGIPSDEMAALDLQLAADGGESALPEALLSPSSSKARLEVIAAGESQLWSPLMQVLALLLMVVLLALLRGGRQGSSVIGVAHCTAAYWSLTALAFALLFCVTVLMGRRLARRHAEKLAAGYQFEVGDIKWGGRNVWLYPLLSAGAGAMGGLLGIGGGMIMGPLLLEFGMLPASTSATSATTVLVTSAAATAQFLVLETLLIDYGLAFGLLGLVATFVGQTLLAYLVRRYQTTSFIVFSIASVMILAVLLMTLAGVQVRYLTCPPPTVSPALTVSLALTVPLALTVAPPPR